MQKFMVRNGIKIISTVIVTVLLWGGTIVASENYAFVSEWGGHGSEEGQFDGPSGIDIDGEDNIYVADRENCRIQKLTSEGKYITAWGSTGSGTEDYFNPTDVTIDNNGTVYVLNSYSLPVDNNTRPQRFCNIQKFTTDGEFITRWGSSGSEDGQFIIPAGIATDSAGYVFIADWDLDLETNFATSRIQKFSPEGEFILKWEASGIATNLEVDFLAWGLAIDDEDNVYILSLLPWSVQKFNTDGEFLAEWDYFSFIEDLFPAPIGIKTDREGNIYITMGVTGDIKKFTSNGEFLTRWAPTPQQGLFSLKPLAWDTAVDSKGNVYVTVPNNDVVQKYAKNGQVEDPCTIEALYGEHAEKTELLRHFRDTILSKTPEGQELIKLYYDWSPVIVKAMETDEKFKGNVKGMIDGFLSLITGGV